MISFTATIQQFKQQGEKTGWSYIAIPAAMASQLKPGNKKSFRIKGILDNVQVAGMALIPMGGGDFILALNASIRKKIRKEKGATLKVIIEVDDRVRKPPDDLMECLADEPAALKYFNSLAPSHRNYFGTWIRSAKTEPTRTKRIAQAITALNKQFDFGQMIRSHKSV